MRISGNVSPVSQVYTNDKKISRVGNVDKVRETRDDIKISDKGKDFAVAMKALKNVPDVRQDKVDDISKRLERKEYEVSGDDIANKLFNSGIDVEG